MLSTPSVNFRPISALVLMLQPSSGAPSTSNAFGVGEMLPLLLTTESLLFAALSAIVALSGETEFGRPLLTPPFGFGLTLAAAIWFASLGALVAWIDVIGWTPTGASATVAAYALLVMILVEPLAAIWVAFALRNRS
jgi:hypothetical protein